MKLRSATLEDVPVLMALETRAVTAAHWTTEQYQAVFASGETPRVALVLEDCGTIQGFLIARATGPDWEIENIAVAGPARRRGLGTRLLGEFLKTAHTRGAAAVFLEVRESNSAARRLYEKWAFIESGRRSGYYRDPSEAAITYRLDFS
ncbi:MAG: ribosomal protein S18-alanine N-acetyltransferase [Terriglobales bacterium]